MPTEIQIRPYDRDDLAQAKALEARVNPYRPEDRPEVEAMFERARRAQVLGDRWIAMTPPLPGLAQVGEVYLAFWVAVLPSDTGPHQIVGTALKPDRHSLV